jgi:hypothetical protein
MHEHVHPALHIDEQGVVLGHTTRAGEYRLVTDERRVLDLSEVAAAAGEPPRPYPALADRWDDEDAAVFLATGKAPAVAEVLARLRQALDEVIEFARPEEAALVATWAVGSYFHPLFLTFPRVALSGERGCGKSKVLTVLQATAFNAPLMLAPTAAVLYRLIQEYRPTLLLDEMENLGRDDARDILAIVNAGYRAGATVPRCVGPGGRRVECFAVYAPLALAAIRTVNGVTEDRCLPLVLQRGLDGARVNAEVDPRAPVFGAIRAGCYRLLLARWRTVRQAYRTIALPDWLSGRARELWKPLLAVAAAAEDGALVPELLALAREHVADRDALSAEGDALLGTLSRRLGGRVTVVVRPSELVEELRTRLGRVAARRPSRSAPGSGAWSSGGAAGTVTGRATRSGPSCSRGCDDATTRRRFTPGTTVTPSPSHAKPLILQAV